MWRSPVALALLALLAGCRRDAPTEPPPSPPEPEVNANPPEDGDSIHFTRLKPFLPDRLAEFEGGGISASTSQFGGVAASEAERGYRAGAVKAKIRILDTNLNRLAGATLSARPKAGPDARALELPGAGGYVAYDVASRQAHANLVVADRIVVAVSVEEVADDKMAEALARAMDLAGLRRLATAGKP